MDYSEFAKKIRNARCTVVGLGVSNLPLVDFLLDAGANVTARDKSARGKIGDVADTFEKKGVPLLLGDDYLDGITEEIIFRSPGLRPDLPPFADAVKRGAILTSEMELFLSLCPARVIGITGSDGKTTTTTLVGLLLEEECRKAKRGRVYVGGNIGTPLLPYVREMTSDDYAVVELSSFQLMAMRHSPHIAAITNLSPNHLNWHTDMEEYVNAKTNIYVHAPCRRLVTNAENAITVSLAHQTPLPKTYFSSVKHHADEFFLKDGDRAIYERSEAVLLFDGKQEHFIMRPSDILLPGRHNLENYMTAVALTDGLVSTETIAHIAKNFKGVPHRLEPVRTFAGVTYYNSSIDSTPSRTAAALSALNCKPIVICGGSDKGTPFEPLADALCAYAKAVVLTGDSAAKIRAALNRCHTVKDGTLPVLDAPDFEGAVRMARSLSEEGDTVLLSPACASFDAFKNFAERGDTFRRIVNSFQ